MKEEIQAEGRPVRLTRVLEWLGGRATWYRRQGAEGLPWQEVRPGRPRGPHPGAVDPWQRHVVETVARACPWYGYKKIALICRRLDEFVRVRVVYRIMREARLLHRLRERAEARRRQEVARLCELLPHGPNELWQTDVTYVPIAGYGWWYAITVIDYYSRYLLALHFTHSYSALEASTALRLAVAEAERARGPLTGPVFLVTDNGPSFIAGRFRDTLEAVRIAATGVGALSHVRIGYRMPTQLGLLERFHETLKREEVYWNLYADPRDARQKLEVFHERYNVARPHWALRAAESAKASAAVLTPKEVYIDGHQVNPPPWSRWVGWLDEDQKSPVQPGNRLAELVSH